MWVGCRGRTNTVKEGKRGVEGVRVGRGETRHENGDGCDEGNM